MAKVIIKANMFMKPKELEDLYKFIYDQYRNKDIILVPSYCDVYVVDGDPKLKVEKTTEFKDIIFNQMKKGDMDAIKKAFELQDNGKSLDEIAEELGYKYTCDDCKPTYSEPACIQNVYNRMANRGATREELDSFRNLIHKYNALEYTANKEDNGND